MLNKNKRGQVGDAVTWVVATVIIVVLLIFFIFGASLLADAKNTVNKVKKSTVDVKYLEKKDLILEKSVFTYFKIADSAEKTAIFSRLQKFEDEGFFTEKLNEKKKEIEGRLK